MDIEEARRDRTARGIDGFGDGLPTERADRRDPAVLDSDVGAKCLAAATVYDVAVLDQNVMHWSVLSAELESFHSFGTPAANQSEVFLRNRGILLSGETGAGLRMALVV